MVPFIAQEISWQISIRDDELFDGEHATLTLSAITEKSSEQTGCNGVSNNFIVQKTNGSSCALPSHVQFLIDCFEGKSLTIQLDSSEADEVPSTISQVNSNMKFFRVQKLDLDPSKWQIDFRSSFRLKIPDAFLDRKLILRVIFSNAPGSPSSKLSSDFETSFDLHSFDQNSLANDSLEKRSDWIERTRENENICVREVRVTRPLATSIKVVLLQNNGKGILVAIKNEHKEAIIRLKNVQLCSRVRSTHSSSASLDIEQNNSQKMCPSILNMLPETLYPKESFTTCFSLEQEDDFECLAQLSLSWSTTIKNHCIDIRESIICTAIHRAPSRHENQFSLMNTEPLLSQFLHDISSTRQQLSVQENVDIHLRVTLIDHIKSEIEVGSQVSICVQVSNASKQKSYDVLVFHESMMQSDQNFGASTGWLSFEISQRLGILDPGMVARRCIRIVLLQVGVHDLQKFLVYDVTTHSMLQIPSIPCEVVVI